VFIFIIYTYKSNKFLIKKSHLKPLEYMINTPQKVQKEKWLIKAILSTWNHLIAGDYIVNIRRSIVLSFAGDHSCGKTLKTALKEAFTAVKSGLIYDVSYRSTLVNN
jgi:hypothetical protein